MQVSREEALDLPLSINLAPDGRSSNVMRSRYNDLLRRVVVETGHRLGRNDLRGWHGLRARYRVRKMPHAEARGVSSAFRPSTYVSSYEPLISVSPARCSDVTKFLCPLSTTNDCTCPFVHCFSRCHRRLYRPNLDHQQSPTSSHSPVTVLLEAVVADINHPIPGRLELLAQGPPRSGHSCQPVVPLGHES